MGLGEWGEGWKKGEDGLFIMGCGLDQLDKG